MFSPAATRRRRQSDECAPIPEDECDDAPSDGGDGSGNGSQEGDGAGVVTSTCITTSSWTELSDGVGTSATAFTITGSSFGGLTQCAIVTAGAFSTDVTSVTDDVISFTLQPENANGDVMIPGQSYQVVANVMSENAEFVGDEGNNAFIYRAHIGSVSPTIGSLPGGTEVTLDGAGFIEGQTQVRLNAVTCDITAMTYTQITCVTRSRSTPIVANVLVQYSGNDALCGVSTGCTFEYAASVTPEVTEITPSEAQGPQTFLMSVTGMAAEVIADDVTVEIGEGNSCIVSIYLLTATYWS